MMLSDILELTTKAKKITLQNLLNQSSIHRERELIQLLEIDIAKKI